MNRYECCYQVSMLYQLFGTNNRTPPLLLPNGKDLKKKIGIKSNNNHHLSACLTTVGWVFLVRWNAEHGSGLAGKLLPARVCSRHSYNDDKNTRTVLLTIFFNFSAHKHRGGPVAPRLSCVSAWEAWLELRPCWWRLLPCWQQEAKWSSVI